MPLLLRVFAIQAGYTRRHASCAVAGQYAVQDSREGGSQAPRRLPHVFVPRKPSGKAERALEHR
jgi:hypothetical protein